MGDSLGCRARIWLIMFRIGMSGRLGFGEFCAGGDQD